MTSLKKIAALLAALLLALSLSACSGDGDEAESSEGASSVEVNADAGSDVDVDAEIPDLTGDWEQSNKNSETDYLVATIEDDVITISWYWIDDEGEVGTSIYWVGTFVAPEAGGIYSWDSEIDHDATDDEPMAATSSSKTFTYEDGVLTFDVTLLGVTTTVEMEKV